LGVHADGIFGAGLHAKAAVDAFAEVDVETFGLFLDIGVGVFLGYDVNAFGRAYGFAHHAGHTARGAVVALGQAVAGAVAFRIAALDLGIKNRDRRGDMPEQANFVQGMQGEIFEKVIYGGVTTRATLN